MTVVTWKQRGWGTNGSAVICGSWKASEMPTKGRELAISHPGNKIKSKEHSLGFQDKLAPLGIAIGHQCHLQDISCDTPLRVSCYCSLSVGPMSGDCCMGKSSCCNVQSVQQFICDSKNSSFYTFGSQWLAQTPCKNHLCCSLNLHWNYVISHHISEILPNSDPQNLNGFNCTCLGCWFLGIGLCAFFLAAVQMWVTCVELAEVALFEHSL